MGTALLFYKNIQDLAWEDPEDPDKVKVIMEQFHVSLDTGPRSAVGNVSGYRYVSDCRSRGREFDPGPVPYFCGD